MELDQNVRIETMVMNQILLLHSDALRIEELDSKVLPLYVKHNLKYDVATYDKLSEMYLKLKQYEIIKDLFKEMR
jgi:hypothetical protein